MYSDHLLDFVKAPLPAITATYIFGYDTTSFAHLVWGIFGNLFCKPQPGWMKTIGG